MSEYNETDSQPREKKITINILFYLVGQLEILVIIGHVLVGGLLRMPVRYGIDERIEVEGGQVGVLRLDVDHVGRVVPGQVHKLRQVVVQVGEGDAILRPDWLADDDLVDVVEFVPVVVLGEGVLHQGLELRTAWI